MTRREREVTDLDAIKSFLDKGKVIHIGLCDGDQPYVVPMNYGYTLQDGKLTFYIHGATSGYKYDVIKKNAKVSFSIECDVQPFEGKIACQYGTAYSSVLGKGVVEVLTDVKEKEQALSFFMKTLTGKEFEFNEKMVSIVNVMKITVSEFTAKQRPLPPGAEDLSIKGQTIDTFLDTLSSKAPVPGGGGASAMAGAFGNALGQMVANLTIGKKKYKEYEEELIGLMEKLKKMQDEFVTLAKQDEVVFEPLAKAYALPTGTEEEKQYKDQVMEERLLDASLVPLAMMEKAVEMLSILETLSVKGSVMAVSDVGVAVQFTKTALLGAVMNVYINTKSMKNREKAVECNEKAEALVNAGTVKADEIYQAVLLKLKGN